MAARAHRRGHMPAAHAREARVPPRAPCAPVRTAESGIAKPRQLTASWMAACAPRPVPCRRTSLWGPAWWAGSSERWCCNGAGKNVGNGGQRVIVTLEHYRVVKKNVRRRSEPRTPDVEGLEATRASPGTNANAAYAPPRIGGRPRIGTHGVGAETEPEQARVREREQARVGQGQRPQCAGGCHLRRVQVAPCPPPRPLPRARAPLLRVPVRFAFRWPAPDPRYSAACSIEELKLDFSDRDISNAAKLPEMLAQVLPGWIPACTRPRSWCVRAVRPCTVRSHACVRLPSRRCTGCRWRIPSTSSLRS